MKPILRYKLRTLLIVLAVAGLTLTFCRSSDSEEDAALPEGMATLAPMLIKWAKDATPLPGLPITDKNLLRDPHGFPDTSFIQPTLKSRRPKFIYIAWNPRGKAGSDKLTYKYEISSGKLSTVDASDLPAISSRFLTVAETARFTPVQLEDGALTIDFQMGWGSAKVHFRRTPEGFSPFKVTDKGTY